MSAAIQAARETEATEIPVIDIGPLRDGTNVAGVAAQLHKASREIGFIYITNHGIEQTLLEQARSNALEFFRRPADEKLQSAITEKHRGFLKIGDAVMQDDVKPDLKESFVWGYEEDDGSVPEDHDLRGRNNWPGDMPAFKDSALGYFNAAHGVAYHLMRGFAVGLGKEEDFFLKSTDRPLSRASFTYYPPQDVSQNSDQFGVGPHTDFGVLTVLCQDDVGGLQVQNLKGEWVTAPPIPGSLVVNVGDLLGRWTNGQYRSTPHRVVNASGRERLSLVLAYDPNPETMIDAHAVFDENAAEAEGAKEGISCGDYLIWRFGKSFAYRR